MFQLKTRTYALMIATITLVGCSALEGPPPSQPSFYGGNTGASMRDELYCRDVGARAAQQARNSNVGAEVGGIALGALVGGVLGNQIRSGGHTHRSYGYVGRTWYGSPVYGTQYHRHGGGDLAGVGAIVGGLGGAGVAQNYKQDEQLAFDRAYARCMGL